MRRRREILSSSRGRNYPATSGRWKLPPQNPLHTAAKFTCKTISIDLLKENHRSTPRSLTLASHGHIAQQVTIEKTLNLRPVAASCWTSGASSCRLSRTVLGWWLEELRVRLPCDLARATAEMMATSCCDVCDAHNPSSVFVLAHLAKVAVYPDADTAHVCVRAEEANDYVTPRRCGRHAHPELNLRARSVRDEPGRSTPTPCSSARTAAISTRTSPPS